MPDDGLDEGRSGLGGGGSSHSPLLAIDVMLLHRIAKEGFPGARDDLGPPGVHVEGVCEPWGGEKRRGEQRRQAGGGLGPKGEEGPTGRSFVLESLGYGGSMFFYPWGAPP